MSLTPAVPKDGNGTTLGNAGVTPGVGYALPQMGPQTADATTGQNVASSVVSLAAANAGLPANLPAIVQKANAVSTGSVASLAATFAKNVTPGNSIVVVCGSGDNGTLSVTDSLGNTYTQAVLKANSTTFQAAIFYAVNILGGADTVTVADTSSDSMAVEIYEVSGILMQAVNQPDYTASATGTGTAAAVGNAIAPTSPNSLAFMGVAVGTTLEAVTANGGTPWTADASLNPGGTVAGLFSLGSLSAPLATTAPLTPAATIAASKPYAIVAAIFKPVVLGVTGTVTLDGYNYTHITADTTTLIKTGAGILHAIIINSHGASATIEFDDALTHTTPVIGIITLPSTISGAIPISLEYDIKFSTGLSITTGTATLDITVVWK